MFPVLMAVLALAAGAAPAAPEKRVTILVLPLEPKGTVSKDTAELTTQLLADEIQQYQGYKVTTFKEIQGTMSQEQLRQLAGCDSEGCAAEIAGALNTDEIVVGQIGSVPGAYVLTVSRLRSRNAETLGRASDRVDAATEALLLERMPFLVETLMGGASKTPLQTNLGPGTSTRPRAPAATEPEQPGPPVLRWVMRGVGASGILAASVLALGGVVSGAVFLAVAIKDRSAADGGIRGIDGNEAMLGNATFYGALIMIPVALLAVLTATGVLGASWVVP